MALTQIKYGATQGSPMDKTVLLNLELIVSAKILSVDAAGYVAEVELKDMNGETYYIDGYQWQNWVSDVLRIGYYRQDVIDKSIKERTARSYITKKY